ncbi:MAG: hypothetical protein SGCHY_004935 [Lobulomycetales sp.]
MWQQLLLLIPAARQPLPLPSVEQLSLQVQANICPNGAVLASPSSAAPNYAFHWVRDAALATDLRWISADAADQCFRFSSLIQHAHHSDLAEPKFYPSGAPFLGPWGRPQHDGPALRALSTISLLSSARILVNTTASQLLASIRTDLHHVSRHIGAQGFDLWEEVYGLHFFTLAVQGCALHTGAQHVSPETGNRYREKADWIRTTMLPRFWDPRNKQINSHLHPHPSKPSNLDTSVLLALLLVSLVIVNQHCPKWVPHAQQPPDILSLSSPATFATLASLVAAFRPMYAINKRYPLCPAIGRYPEDTYDGVSTGGSGNPWVLATAAFAEYFFVLAGDHVQGYEARRFAEEMAGAGRGAAFWELGDCFLQRVLFHAARAAHDNVIVLHEQMNRDTGFQQGAVNLTWSYVSLIRAIKERGKLERRWADVSRTSKLRGNG